MGITNSFVQDIFLYRIPLHSHFWFFSREKVFLKVSLLLLAGVRISQLNISDGEKGAELNLKN